MCRMISAICLAASLFVPFATWAAPITIPTGLNFGDQYRLAFVTSTARTATSSNISDYNAFVTAVANSVPELVALGTNWKAIASTGGSFSDTARGNTSTQPFTPGAAIYTLGDTLVATNYADLWDGNLLAPINYWENGQQITTPNWFVWTGTSISGDPGPSFAPLNPLGFPTPRLGSAVMVGPGWVDYSTVANNQFLAMYAISDILTVVPEPNAAALALVGFLFAAWGWQRRKR